jgi:hypothetical protein
MNIGLYRNDLLRNNLIELENLYKDRIANGPDGCDFIPVFTGESFSIKSIVIINLILNPILM